MVKYFKFLLFIFSGVLISCSFLNSKQEDAISETGNNWPVYGGNKLGNRYSPLDQINKNNVKKLKVAWSYNAVENDEDKGQIQCQPIVIDGVLYGTSPSLRLFALEADTGVERWSFVPKLDGEITGKNTSRGVAYWKKGNDERILYTVGSYLFAINSKSGTPITSFGINGKIDLHTGVGSGIDKDVNSLSITATSPGVIYKDIYIIGSSVAEGGNAAPGTIRAYTIGEGKLLWTFHTVPHPNEPGYNSWPKDAYQNIGGVNSWAGMVVDNKRGTVYFGTGSPSSDFYGGNRAGKNLFANCVISLDAATGKLNWYYQTIYHDLWDRDISCQPNLATIDFNGNKIDVVAQATKDGLLYILNRDTGEPIFPIEEREVPVNGLPGEEPWPVQKYPTKPEPFSRQIITKEDITNLSQESNKVVMDIFNLYDSDNKFTPPNEKGTLLIGYSGGAEWGGNAIDNESVLYQNANEEPWILEMIATDDYSSNSTKEYGKSLYIKNCIMCHGATMEGSGMFPSLLDLNKRFTKEEVRYKILLGSGRMPSFKHLSTEEINKLISYITTDEEGGNKMENEHNTIEILSTEAVPQEESNVFGFEPKYVVKTWKKLVDEDDYPGITPPWGTLNAIDLNTGDYKWRIPLGEYDELSQKGIPITGTINYGGPIVTAGGLVFIAATMDEKIRAFDKDTGEMVWEYKLPAAGFATPITYAKNNKQYIVIAAGGGRGLKYGRKYIAFSL